LKEYIEQEEGKWCFLENIEVLLLG
jgi:hypothetical protein